MEHQARFVKVKETNNTIVFKEAPEKGVAPIIGSLYVQKHIAGDAEEVTVLLTVGAAVKPKARRAAA
jgi:hypothetical protein